MGSLTIDNVKKSFGRVDVLKGIDVIDRALDIRSTAADMATYIAGTASGTAPGAAAASEVLFEDGAESRHAMNWFQQDIGDGVWSTFHNGMTGGYAAFAGFVPETGRGIVILTDTARSVDALALEILTGEVAL